MMGTLPHLAGPMQRALIRLTERLRRQPRWTRYTTAAAIALAAIGLRMTLLGPILDYPYVTAYPAVVIAGLFLGAGPGLLCFGVSSALAVYFFVAPAHAFSFVNAADALGFVLYAASSLGVLLATALLHVAAEGMREANEALIRLGAERELLQREAAHRRQNDLARLIATLNLQANSSASPEARHAFEDAADRVMALVRVDRAFQSSSGPGGAADTREFLKGIATDIAEASGGHLRPVSVDVDIQRCRVPKEQLIPLGLVATELLTNVFKYAFPGGRAGRLALSFVEEGHRFALRVSDNGIGFDPDAPPQGGGLGRKLVEALAAQLGGTVTTRTTPGQGTEVILHFPAPERSDCAPAADAELRSDADVG